MEKEFCAMYIPFSTIMGESLAFEFNRNGELSSGGVSKTKTDNEKPYEYIKHIHLVFDMEELIRYDLFRDKLVEGYELTGQIKEKLFDFRDKVRSGKLDIGDQPYFFEPKDLL